MLFRPPSDRWTYRRSQGEGKHTVHPCAHQGVSWSLYNSQGGVREGRRSDPRPWKFILKESCLENIPEPGRAGSRP